MEQNIKYRIAARTEAAGKYNPDAPQEGNEDNYGIIYNVASPTERVGFDSVMPLGKYGLLMFVADGMGGHNAGEVASKIAVDTVVEAFANGRINAEIYGSHQSRSNYMERVIALADKRIREHAKQHKECEGMGSTLIIAWLAGNQLSVSWCGDSRCYLYRPGDVPRIAMVSEDHSYVQELVQRGVIPYEATFAHPRGNIVTRCLGGGGDEAQPESRMATLGKGDMVLLCSDGLSGVLFDDGRLFDGEPISAENICDTITAHNASLRDCVQELFAAAERGQWYDNVTAILCQVVEGPDAIEGYPFLPQTESVPTPTIPPRRRPLWWIYVLAAVALIGIGTAGYMLLKNNKPAPAVEVKDTSNNDTTPAAQNPAVVPPSSQPPTLDKGSEEKASKLTEKIKEIRITDDSTGKHETVDDSTTKIKDQLRAINPTNGKS